MLSLVAVVLVIFLGVAIYRVVANKRAGYIGVIVGIGFALVIVLICDGLLFESILVNNEDDIQTQINTLTQENEQIEEWREVVKERLTDETDLLQQIDIQFKEKLENNNQTISVWNNYRNETLPILRWLVYFG